MGNWHRQNFFYQVKSRTKEKDIKILKWGNVWLCLCESQANFGRSVRQNTLEGDSEVCLRPIPVSGSFPLCIPLAVGGLQLETDCFPPLQVAWYGPCFDLPIGPFPLIIAFNLSCSFTMQANVSLNLQINQELKSVCLPSTLIVYLASALWSPHSPTLLLFIQKDSSNHPPSLSLFLLGLCPPLPGLPLPFLSPPAPPSPFYCVLPNFSLSWAWCFILNEWDSFGKSQKTYQLWPNILNPIFLFSFKCQHIRGDINWWLNFNLGKGKILWDFRIKFLK